MKLMRRFICQVSILFLVTCASSQVAHAAASDWTADYNRLLAKYVTPDGVRYAEWKKNEADMQAIDGVVKAIAGAQPGGDRNTQFAFHLNAYNAWILHEALGKYPTKSVKDTLFTFFTAKRIKVAGEEMSFTHLEKDVIRPKYGEPRIHFALNCASRSCPPLQAEAFAAGKLDGQLEKLAKAFVNTERGVDYKAASKTAELSKIFDWYKDDFAKGGGVMGFINKRRATPIPADAKISYQNYNWGLNEAK